LLPTFVIGLREGLEAALIVGIIAAFLRKQGRPELIRQMALGVAAAIVICIAVGVGLEIFSQNLPQQQQEGLETVIGVLAVGMVTYMVLWMKEHSRGLKGELESMTAEALEGGAGHAAMIFMAFLAVLREGFETAVFLLAAFNESDSGTSALVGALLGIGVAVALGYGIYRGGVRINLSKFFRATGVVLVLVAGGLVVSAIHTAHEAGWLNAGQNQMLDLAWLVRPGTVISSLLTGMLGIQPYPVMAEVLGWLLYVVPLIVFVAWPPGRAVPVRALRAGLAAVGVLGLGAGAAIAATAPSVATPAPASGSGQFHARIITGGGHLAVHTSDAPLRHQLDYPVDNPDMITTIPLRDGVLTSVDSITAETYRVTRPGTTSGTIRLPVKEAAALNGGRMPLGVIAHKGTVGAKVTTARVLTVAVEPRTQRVLSLSWRETQTASLIGSSGQSISVSKPMHTATAAMSAADSARARAAATKDLRTLADRTDRMSQAWLCGLLGAAALAGLFLSLVRLRRPSRVTKPTASLIKT